MEPRPSITNDCDKSTRLFPSSESRISVASVVFAIIIGAIVIGIAAFTQSGGDAALDFGDLAGIDQGWHYVDAESGEYIAVDISTTKTIRSQGRNTLTLSGTLPDDLPAGSYIVVGSASQTTVVTVSGRTIISYNDDSQYDFANMPSTIPCIAALPKDSSGAPIEITYSRLDGANFNIGTVSTGSSGAVMQFLLAKSAPALLFAFFMLIIAILMLVYFAILRAHRIGLPSKPFLHLGLSCLLIAFWLATDQNFIQLFTGSFFIANLAKYFVFMLMPIPFIFFFKDYCPRYAKMFDTLIVLFVANFAAMLGLHLLHIADLRATLITTHSLMLALVVCGIWALAHERRAHDLKAATTLLTGILLFLALGGIAVIVFRATNGRGPYSLIFMAGMTAMVVTFAGLMIGQSMNVLLESAKADTYRHLAYWDEMTGMANRTALIHRQKDIQDMEPADKWIGVAVFDIDNLKKINDEQGHLHGDEVIRDAASCIIQAFSSTSDRLYRYGGDEFVAIIDDAPPILEREFSRLDDALAKGGRMKPGSFSISYGYARANLNAKTDGFLAKILQEADENMYAMKSRGHARSE